MTGKVLIRIRRHEVSVAGYGSEPKSRLRIRNKGEIIMTPYRLWNRQFKDLPPEVQEKLRLPSDTKDFIFYDSLSVEDKKALLRTECGYDPEESE